MGPLKDFRINLMRTFESFEAAAIPLSSWTNTVSGVVKVEAADESWSGIPPPE